MKLHLGAFHTVVFIQTYALLLCDTLSSEQQRPLEGRGGSKNHDKTICEKSKCVYRD